MNMSIDNLFPENFNSLLFSLMGMVVVFFGLVVICLYVFYLPQILDRLSRWKQTYKESCARRNESQNLLRVTTVKEDKISEDNHIDILLAVATAYHFEENTVSDNQKFTWRLDRQPCISWNMASLSRGTWVRNRGR